MNMMGFTSDGLGNHNFDDGQSYLRSELIPLADFPFLTANIVDPATQKTPPEWAPSRIFDRTFHGFKVAIIGFSNNDLATLTFPGGLAPFVVTDAKAAILAEVARLRAKGKVNAIVAVGHEGATAGTLASPTGPLIDLADQVTGVDLLIVDYLQLMRGDYRSENRVQEISSISRALKALARELNVPLMALSQLSRSVESRQDKHPQLSDLRESGALEQDADVVIFIYRDELYNPNTERKNIADIIVAKHRNGPTGTVALYFKKELAQFREAEMRRSEFTSY